MQRVAVIDVRRRLVPPPVRKTSLAHGLACHLGEEASVVTVRDRAVEQDLSKAGGGGVCGDVRDFESDVVGEGVGDAVNEDRSVGGDLDVEAGRDVPHGVDRLSQPGSFGHEGRGRQVYEPVTDLGRPIGAGCRGSGDEQRDSRGHRGQERGRHEGEGVGRLGEPHDSCHGPGDEGHDLAGDESAGEGVDADGETGDLCGAGRHRVDEAGAGQVPDRGPNGADPGRHGPVDDSERRRDPSVSELADEPRGPGRSH